jgi:hypothetical protein
MCTKLNLSRRSIEEPYPGYHRQYKDRATLAEYARTLARLVVLDVFRQGSATEAWDDDLALKIGIGLLEAAAEDLRIEARSQADA